MLKSESITKVASALLKAQSVMTAALKDAKNPFFKSSYADLNSVLDASRPALNANGISVVQSTSSRVNEQGVRVQVLETILLHESGEYIGSETDIVVKANGNAQDYGSAISYARRYGLQALVALKGEDDDGNGASGKVVHQQGVTKSVVAASTQAASESASETKAETVTPPASGGFKRKPKPTAAAPQGDVF
jgi:hypothetical protein